jgi:hypothetical protein
MDDDFTCTPYCALLHADLWREIEYWRKETEDLWGREPSDITTSDGHVLPVRGGIEDALYLPPHGSREYGLYLCHSSSLDDCIMDALGDERWNVAGKNFASFGCRFLERYLEEMPFRHRVMDPAQALLQPNDKTLPNTEECLKRLGFGPTASHTALGDAFDVVRMVRAQLVLPRPEHRDGFFVPSC